MRASQQRRTLADPVNLGVILCALGAVGGNGVHLLENSADPYDPTAVRARMGVVFNQQMVQTGFEQLADWARQHDVPVADTFAAATLDDQATRYPPSWVLLMGNERRGASLDREGQAG